MLIVESEAPIVLRVSPKTDPDHFGWWDSEDPANSWRKMLTI